MNTSFLWNKLFGVAFQQFWRHTILNEKVRFGFFLLTLVIAFFIHLSLSFLLCKVRTIISVLIPLLHSPLLAPQAHNETDPLSQLSELDHSPSLPIVPLRNFCTCVENSWKLNNQRNKSLMVKCKAVRKIKARNILVDRSRRDRALKIHLDMNSALYFWLSIYERSESKLSWMLFVAGIPRSFSVVNSLLRYVWVQYPHKYTPCLLSPCFQNHDSPHFSTSGNENARLFSLETLSFLLTPSHFFSFWSMVVWRPGLYVYFTLFLE